MDGPALNAGRERRPAIGRLADGIEEPPEHRLSDRHADGRARAMHACAPPQPRCAFERHGAHCSGIEMLMDLRDKGPAEIPLDRDGFVDSRQAPGRKLISTTEPWIATTFPEGVGSLSVGERSSIISFSRTGPAGRATSLICFAELKPTLMSHE